MTWQAQWGDKLVSADTALERIAPTDHVFTAGLTGTPCDALVRLFSPMVSTSLHNNAVK